MNQDICRKHGLNIVYRQGDDFSQGFCNMCVQDNYNMIPENEVQEKLAMVISNLINCQQQFIDKTNQDFNIMLNNLSQLTQDVKQLQINIIKEANKLLDIFKGFYSVDFSPIHQAINNFIIQIEFKKEQELINISLNQILESMETIYQQNNNQQIFDQILLEVKYNRNDNQQQQLFKSQRQFNQLIVQPLNGYSIQFDNKHYCKALAINSDGKILAVGHEKIIFIYEVREGMLIQKIVENDAHQDKILCLSFMKKNDQLLSGGATNDKQIKIWQINKNLQIEKRYTLSGHTDSIYCLLFNENEDLIISGSKDQTIKFWNKNQEWMNQQTLNFESQILSMSLNQSENQLISALKNAQVYVLKKSSYQKWEISSKIGTNGIVLRLLFLNDDEFVIQEKEKQVMELYKYNQYFKVFYKTEFIDLKENENNNNDEWLFPMKFIKNQSLLINKNGRYIHFIQRQKNGQFTILKSLEFQSQYLYGTVTNDGKFLFTWDYYTSKIQVKKITMQ